jgi:hypothetical protein
MAGVMWLRSRNNFYRWSLRFVALSFLAFVFFALTPSGPSWAAARCTAAQVANHPNSHVVANRIERWRYRRSAPDTLEVPPESMQETPCPPSRPLPETTPSST